MQLIAYAHRGGADVAPENTMPAFASAVALGYRWLETDVHVTRDGVVVAFHDDRLDRVTDRTGRIADLTLAEVREADAGYSFTLDDGATQPFRGRGVTVPTLEEVLTAWPHVSLNIDAKEDVTVAPLMALLRRLNALTRVCLASFSDARLRRMRVLAGGRVLTSMGQRAVITAYACSRAGRMPRLGADRVQVPLRFRGVRVADRRFVQAAHRAGLAVDVWTVNTAPEMHELIDIGADGIMSDRSRLLREVLTARGRWENGADMRSATPSES